MFPSPSVLVRRRRGLVAIGILLGSLPSARTQAAEAIAQAEIAPSPSDNPPAAGSPPPGYSPPPSAAPAAAVEPATPAPSAPAAAPTATAPVDVAQSAQPGPAAPRPYSLAASLSTSILSETNSTSVVTAPLLEGAYAILPSVLVDLTLGFGWLVDNQGLGESTFRAGNPQLSMFYREGLGPWLLRGSLGVTAPLARVPLGPDGRLYESIYNRTLATWGMWNQWLWARDRMAAPLALRADYAFPGGQVLTAEAGLAFLFGVAGGARSNDLVAQMALEALLPLTPSFALCPRLQTVVLSRDSIDRWQSAAGLRGVLSTSAGRFFVMALLNLDEPLGALGGGARWGLHLGKELDL
jgi:hypothetical protein